MWAISARAGIVASVIAVLVASSAARAGDIAPSNYASLAGPLWVTIGQPVTLYAANFPPSRRLSVEIDLGRSFVGAHPCCSSNVAFDGRTDLRGRAKIQLRWPRRYTISPGGTQEDWKHQSVALVTVTSDGWGNLRNPDAGRATKVVYVN
jgi:hypothetical protein